MAYNIEEIPVEDLSVYVNNSRTHSTEQVKQISNSIKEFGFTNPLLIDKNKEIIAGHGRLMAAKQLGLDKVPCIELSNLSEKQKKAYVIADNQLALNAGWNESILSMEIGDLSDNDFDISLLGFNDLDLNKYLLKEFEGLTDEDETPEPPEEPITKLGNIWKLGKHKLICGDSTAEDTFKNLFNDNKADLIFTDPPYNVDYSGRGENDLGKIKNDNMSENDFIDFLYKNFNLMSDYLKPLGCIYVCHSDSHSKPKIAFEINFDKFFKKSSTIIWDKGNAGMGWQDYRSQHEPILYGWKEGQGKHSFYGDRKNTSIWNVKRDNVAGYKHPTQKPVALSQKAVLNNSKEDDIIFDSFLGSGSTLIACEKTNRKCYGIELDPKYCDVIMKRWENFTGKKAKLIKDNHATT
jgi:DNA modification methylase